METRTTGSLAGKDSASFPKKLTIGGELFYNTASTEESTYRFGFNVGAIVNFTDEHHFIFSAGRDFHGENLFSAYAAYLWTFGPFPRKAFRTN